VVLRLESDEVALGKEPVAKSGPVLHRWVAAVADLGRLPLLGPGDGVAIGPAQGGMPCPDTG